MNYGELLDSSGQVGSNRVRDASLPRRRFLRTTGIVVGGGVGLFSLAGSVGGSLGGAAVTSMAGTAGPGDACAVPSPARALDRLLRGNARWVAGELRHPHQSVERREAQAAGQCPLATVVTCIDSRVSPEVLFDAGIGDLFVVRTAAHVLDDIATGSVEYGPHELGTPLILVLGHGRCGAVTAAVEAIRDRSKLPGHLQTIVEAVRPAYESACRPEPTRDCVDRTIHAHTRRTVGELRRDPLLASSVEKGRLRIVGGYYALDTGRVSLLRGQ
ncbi:MAG: carbonic anhydrase [Streptosporangiales bacterium]|nr:carbonic anhydrase [Streptosporangiales bacterium]